MALVVPAVGENQGPAPQLRIRLLECATVAEGQIRLGQVAEVQGTDEKAAAIREIELGQAPLPGRKRSVTCGYIKMRMRAAGIDLSSVVFSGPEEVLVIRAPEDKNGGEEKPAPTVNGAVKDPGPDGNRHQKRNLAVRRGDELMVHVECGLVRVTALGRAMDEGEVGDVVRVQVLQGKRVLVRLTGVREGEVLCGAAE
ncbi:MAG: flagella basal body P-ring formation protein FlgA [Armatimonadetes bacterium]|nr:flagella basal body P-ring formation protein FlgA [Armatimonadota bacterium]